MAKSEINDFEKKPLNAVEKKATGCNNWKSFLETDCSEKIGKLKFTDGDHLTLNVDADDEDGKKLRGPGYCVAIDCEMVGVGADGKENMLARVSIVDHLGECLYDTFVKATSPVTDYRTAVSGVRPLDMDNGEKFTVVQKKVSKLLRGRILVGHAVHNDLIVLKLRHPKQDIRDTTHFKKFRELHGGTPSLKKLTSHYLHVDIQTGEHNSIQDAQAAMQLYVLYKKEWEAEIRKNKHVYHHKNHKKKTVTASHRPKRMHKNYNR